MNYKRHQNHILNKRLKEPRRFIQVIYGPRQVGKTTMVTQFLDESELNYHFVSADAVGQFSSNWIEQQWDLARLQLKQSGKKSLLLVIDEIQKINNWSEAVKKQWDSDTKTKTPIKVIILGSSRLLLQHDLTESLAGRFETIYMGHWTFSEMSAAFGLDENRYVWFGGYPGSIALMEDETRWKEYVRDSLIETCISKDILMLTRVDKPVLLKRVFELGCIYSGQILSYTKIVGQLQDAGNTTTLAHYLKLMDTAGLLAGIEKFSPNILRKRSSSPKFQVYNTAFISAQRQETYNEINESPSKWGRAVESAVGAHLLNHSQTESFNLSYWRNGINEVDFVLEMDRQIIGLEIKSGTEKNISGLQAFKKQYPECKTYHIGKNGLSWQDFLSMNPIDLF